MIAAAFNYGPNNFHFKELTLSSLTEFSYKYVSREALKIHPLLPLSINTDIADIEVLNEDEGGPVPIDNMEISEKS